MLAIGMIASVNAQSNALGLRFNLVNAGVEASYQNVLTNANRIEVNLGLDLDRAFQASALYQWVWDLPQLEAGFKWYAGVGGSLILFGGGFAIGMLGNVGIEYNFDFPLQLSLDMRPGFYLFNGGSDFAHGGVALGVRYKF